MSQGRAVGTHYIVIRNIPLETDDVISRTFPLVLISVLFPSRLSPFTKEFRK